MRHREAKRRGEGAYPRTVSQSCLKNSMHLPFASSLTLFSHIIGCLSDFEEVRHSIDEIGIVLTLPHALWDGVERCAVIRVIHFDRVEKPVLPFHQIMIMLEDPPLAMYRKWASIHTKVPMLTITSSRIRPSSCYFSTNGGYFFWFVFQPQMVPSTKVSKTVPSVAIAKADVFSKNCLFRLDKLTKISRIFDEISKAKSRGVT